MQMKASGVQRLTCLLTAQVVDTPSEVRRRLQHITVTVADGKSISRTVIGRCHITRINVGLLYKRLGQYNCFKPSLCNVHCADTCRQLSYSPAACRLLDRCSFSESVGGGRGRAVVQAERCRGTRQPGVCPMRVMYSCQ